MRATRLVAAVAALVCSSAPAAAQGGLPLNLQVGIPQGEFANNVSIAGGFGVAGLFPLASEFGIRAGLDLQIYGSERRRVPLGGGVLGLILVDVTTTNAIVGGSVGAQVGLPSGRAKPYLAGMLGFSNFNTVSRAEGSNSDDEPFASTTNSSDNAFAKHVLAGLYLPLADGKVLFDIGGRYTWNGESVRYLTPGDISEDAGGNVIIKPNETRADLLTITIGVTIRFDQNRAR